MIMKEAQVLCFRSSHSLKIFYSLSQMIQFANCIRWATRFFIEKMENTQNYKITKTTTNASIYVTKTGPFSKIQFFTKICVIVTTKIIKERGEQRTQNGQALKIFQYRNFVVICDRYNYHVCRCMGGHLINCG